VIEQPGFLKRKHMKRTILAGIIIMGIMFRIWASQPTWMNGDENYYINIFQNYADRGELTPYMWRLGGETNIIAGSGTGYGIYVLIGWMMVFGESLFGLRMLMVVAGLLTAWVYYLVSRRWWENEVAGVAAMVFGLVSTSAFYSLVGRMDAVANLSYSLLLLLHIAAVQQPKKWPHFWVGVVAILTTEFHIIGLQYVGALAVYYMFRYLQLVRSKRKLVLDVYPVYFFFGAGLLGVLYILVHILPNPDAYFVIPSTCAICFHNILEAEKIRFLHVLGLRPIEFILILIILYSQVRHKQTNRHFLILFLGYFIAQIVIGPPPYIQYFHHVIPLLSVGVGGVFLKLVSDSKPDKKEPFKTALLVMAVLVLGFNLTYLLSDRLPYENAYRMPETAELEFIHENIPDSTVVLSTAKNFYVLKQYRNFLDYTDQINYRLRLRGETRTDYLQMFNPEVIYLDDNTYTNEPMLQQFIADREFVQVTPNLWVAEALTPGD